MPQYAHLTVLSETHHIPDADIITVIVMGFKSTGEACYTFHQSALFRGRNVLLQTRNSEYLPVVACANMVDCIIQTYRQVMQTRPYDEWSARLHMAYRAQYDIPILVNGVQTNG